MPLPVRRAALSSPSNSPRTRRTPATAAVPSALMRIETVIGAAMALSYLRAGFLACSRWWRS